MNDEYRQRLKEVRYIVSILQSMENTGDKISKSENEQHFVDYFTITDCDLEYRDYLNISKASMLIMVYNLIESTVTTFIQSVYDEISDLNVEYADISDVLKELWLEVRFKESYKIDSSFNSYKNKAKDLITEIINKNTVEFNLNKIPGVSGNLDSKGISDIYKKHGIRFSTSSKANYKDGMLTTIKRRRNDLAHGNISFMECGREISILEFDNNINEIENYLSDLEVATNRYIQGQLFKNVSGD